jgi:hypothetical protein
MQQQVVGMARIDQLAVVAGQRFEAAIRRFDEDIGLVSGLSQHPLNAEYFVADRVAITERRQNLVHGRSWAAGVHAPPARGALLRDRPRW